MLIATPIVDPLADLFGIFEEQEKLGVTDASGRIVALREMPGSLWLIDHDTIAHSPGLDIYDMLNTLPGVVRREWSLNHAESSMRAQISFPDLHSLVVIDGRSVTSGGAGAFYDRKLLNLHDVERIEVVNGPNSTLYGPNAFFGVVSVQRKKPRRQGDVLELTVDGGLATGANGLIYGAPLTLAGLGGAHASYDHGWGSGGMRISASGQYLPSFGYQTDAGGVINEPGKRVQGTVDVRQAVGPWELRVQGDAAAKRSVYEVGEGGITDQQDYSLNLLAEREKINGADDRLLLNAWVRSYRVNLRPQLAGIPITDFDTRMLAAELRAVYALPTFYGNSLTVGGQTRFSNNQTNYTLVGSPNQLMLGVFAEDTYKPISWLVLTAGIRLDTSESFVDKPLRFFAASPRASAAWLINDHHSIRLDYANAYRTPQILERQAVLSSGGYAFTVGDPNIKNESVHGFTLAWLGRVGFASLRTEAYLSRTLGNAFPTFEPFGSNVFADPDGKPLYRPPGGGLVKLPYYFRSSDGFWIPGALASVELKPVDGMKIWGNYTFVPNDVNHFAGVGVDWAFRRLTLSTQAYFADQGTNSVGETPASLKIHAKAGYTLDARGVVTLAVTVMNLFDARFFTRPTNGAVLLAGDWSTGERLGPRLWVTVDLRPFN